MKIKETLNYFQDMYPYDLDFVQDQIKGIYSDKDLSVINRINDNVKLLIKVGKERVAMDNIIEEFAKKGTQ